MAKYISVDDLRAATTKCNKIWNTITDASGRGLDEIIDSLPSAQLDIIRCKDCKNSEHWYMDRRRCFLWSDEGVSVFDDVFCSYGERKTDGSDK